MALNEKQKRFCEEYLIDLNATQAAIRAGYSVKTANEQGSQLLAKLSVQEEISAKMAERSKRTGVNQDRIVQELARLAFCNLTDVVDRDGKIRDSATEDDLACIESMKVKKTSTGNGEYISDSEEREVKIYSKLKALELLGKHLGMWRDKQDINIALPVVITGENELED